ncbi:PRTRC system protein B (plasmid) [Sphingobium fuliginis]|jgi:PRTRC genetic system protein B|uniref:PRTRC system protein B n=1 Tax=Sphingobium fuliginis (strain ATCC 27551) TaxID=336203 RepID=A0A7M2GQC5_SPHSA|nr:MULTISPECIES: PRTRC system protein B [Sphingobium]QOT74545.1 PRTRC system protein B [Sphingobium fuliginis]
MSDHSAQFEATTGGMVLTNAILLYRTDTNRKSNPYGLSGQGGPAFASIHSVEHGDETGPTIAAGTPLTRAHLRQWAEALGRAAPPEILPDAVLVAHPDMLVWWTPAQVRPAYFHLSSPPDGLRALSGRTIAPVPYPAHLFVATRRRLEIYALSQSERPTAATRLLHSPILNVFTDGSLCWGNIPRPKTLATSAIPEFERALFDSWSTHPNPGQELTVTGKGGLIKLWDDLAARGASRFPVSRLKPFVRDRRRGKSSKSIGAAEPMTLGRLIHENAAR